MNRFFCLTSMALLLASLGSGCTTAAKEGIGFAMGAKGTYVPLEPLAASDESRPLGEYKRFELEITDDFGGRTPPELISELPMKLDEQLANKKIPNNGTGKTLLIRVKVLHYEDSSMVGIALGPLEEVVTRVTMVDKDTGNVLGLANCVGRTTTRLNVGVPKKASGLAKGIVGWIDKHYPETERLE